jgi:hypothetical protein
MNVRYSGLIVLAALASAAACRSNPTADGSGTPAMVLADFDSVAIDSIGGTGSFTAWVVDSRLTPLVQSVSFAMCGGGSAIATVANDGSFAPVPAGTRYRAIITGHAAGATCVVASAAGLKPDTVRIVVP